MAEPARQLASPAPIAAPPMPRRPVLFCDYLQAEPIAQPAPRPASQRILQALGSAFFVAALILGAALLWSVT